MSSQAIPSGQYFDLLYFLAWRDVRVRYKQSLLGIGWAVILPVSMMLVFTFVLRQAVRLPVETGVRVPYALYAFSGLVPWTFFSMSLSGCIQSLVANRNLVTKVFCPRELFPFSSIVSCGVDFAISFVFLLGLMGYFRLTGAWLPDASSWSVVSLLFLPLLLFLQLLLTAGLGLLLAMGNLFYRDVRPMFTIGIQLLMFLSAVVIPIPDSNSLFAQIIRLNPLVSLMDGYRSILLYGLAPSTLSLVHVAVSAVICMAVGWRLFRRSSHRFAECI
ncbi:MAG: ABC transporter permease [Phycisphaerae bacterium]